MQCGCSETKFFEYGGEIRGTVRGLDEDDGWRRLSDVKVRVFDFGPFASALACPSGRDFVIF